MSTTREERDEEGARSFTVFLSEVGEGKFAGELAEKLREVVKAITETAAATCRTAGGELALKLVLKADEKGYVDVKPDVKVKLPPAIRSASKFRATPSNNLSTVLNPRQLEMPLREIPGGKAEVKTIDAKQGVKSL